VARSTTRRENHALLHRGLYYPPLQAVLSRGRLPRSALSPTARTSRHRSFSDLGECADPRFEPAKPV